MDSTHISHVEMNFSNQNDVPTILLFDATNNAIHNTVFTDCIFDHCKGEAIKLLVPAGANATGRIRTLVFLGCRATSDEAAGGATVRIDNSSGLSKMRNIQFIGGLYQSRKDNPVIDHLNGAADILFQGCGFIDNDGTGTVSPHPVVRIAAGTSGLRVRGCYVQSNTSSTVCTFTHLAKFLGLGPADRVEISGNDCRPCTLGIMDTTGLGNAQCTRIVHFNNLHDRQEGAARLVTTATTTVNIMGINLPVEGRSYMIEVGVNWNEGTTGTGHQRLIAVGKLIAGAAVLVNVATIYNSGTSPVTINASATNLQVRITPPNINSINWSADIIRRADIGP
jgi:hypothetical protein